MDYPTIIYGVITEDGNPANAISVTIENITLGGSDTCVTNILGQYVYDDLSSLPNGFNDGDSIRVSCGSGTGASTSTFSATLGELYETDLSYIITTSLFDCENNLFDSDIFDCEGEEEEEKESGIRFKVFREPYKEVPVKSQFNISAKLLNPVEIMGFFTLHQSKPVKKQIQIKLKQLKKVNNNQLASGILWKRVNQVHNYESESVISIEDEQYISDQITTDVSSSIYFSDKVLIDVSTDKIISPPIQIEVKTEMDIKTDVTKNIKQELDINS